MSHDEFDDIDVPDKPKDEGPDQKALKDIERIFSQWGELKEKVRHAASLCRFVASRIEPRRRVLELPDEVATRFESVCLWLRKTLPELAPEVREQALKLLDKTQAESTIAALHTLGDECRRRLRFRQTDSIVAAMASALGMFKIGIDDTTAEMLREEQLQSTKVALVRLSGMLDYAAYDLDEVEDIDDVFYRKHYDPQQVDRARVFVLLQTLQDQIERLPDDGIKQRLVANVEQLKRETQRPRPRWRSFLGKAIIFLAIIADIKTMHPEIGDDILRTVDVVIQTVVTGCQVTPKHLPVNSQDDGPRHWAIEPKRIEFKRQDEGENGNDDENSG